MVFFVTDKAKGAIIGQDGCKDLGLIQRISVETVKAETYKPLTLRYIDQRFSNNFEDYGLYEKEYNIKLDPSVPPVIQPARKIPYTKHDQLKATLEELEKKNIIAPTDKPADWVSNLVITEKKNGQIRICLNPKPLTKAIKQERYNILTPAEVQKEPLLSHPVPERPWQQVGSDILTFQNVDYLLVVDYYSKYPEIIIIEDKSAGTIITKMKAIFA